MRDSADGSGVMHAHLRTPRAVAIAGVMFSVLLFAVFLLTRHSVPRDPLETGAWLHTGATSVVIALNLVPFAGIAFLWFVGSGTSLENARISSSRPYFSAAAFCS